MRNLSTQVNRSMQPHMRQPGQGDPAIDAQWRKYEPPTTPNGAERKPIKIPAAAGLPAVAWLAWMGVLIAIANNQIGSTHAVWFTGGMVVGALSSMGAMWAALAMVVSANRQ